MVKENRQGSDQCLKLRLIAWDEASKNEVTGAGHIARLDLTLKSRKKWSNVVQHLVKKWTGVTDISLRLQIFSVDEYGKPTLDFITSFSTFTVGSSLCTHPALLHPTPSCIPTVELYYHLKVPIFPYTNTHHHDNNNVAMDHLSASTSHFQQNGNHPLPLDFQQLPNPSPYSAYPNNSFLNSFQTFPYLGHQATSLALTTGPGNLSPTEQQSLYPLNTALSMLAQPSTIPPLMSSSVPFPSQTKDINTTKSLGKRPSHFTLGGQEPSADTQEKKAKSNERNEHVMGVSSYSRAHMHENHINHAHSEYSEETHVHNEASLLIGTDTMQIFGGFLNSPQPPSKQPSTPSSPSAISSKGEAYQTTLHFPKGTEPCNTLSHSQSHIPPQPDLPVYESYSGHSFSIGADTMCIFEDLNTSSVLCSPSRPPSSVAKPINEIRGGRQSLNFGERKASEKESLADTSSRSTNGVGTKNIPYSAESITSSSCIDHLNSSLSHPQESMTDVSLLNMLQSFISSPEKSQSRFKFYAHGSEKDRKDMYDGKSKVLAITDKICGFLSEKSTGNDNAMPETATPFSTAIAASTPPSIATSFSGKDISGVTCNTTTSHAPSPSSFPVSVQLIQQQKMGEQLAETLPETKCVLKADMQIAATADARGTEELVKPPVSSVQLHSHPQQQQKESVGAVSISTTTTTATTTITSAITSPPLTAADKNDLSPCFAHISVLSANKRPGTYHDIYPDRGGHQDRNEDRLRDREKDGTGREPIVYPCKSDSATAPALDKKKESSLLPLVSQTVNTGNCNFGDHLALYYQDNNGSNSTISSGTSSGGSLFDERDRDSETLVDDSENEVLLYSMSKSRSQSCLQGQGAKTSVSSVASHSSFFLHNQSSNSDSAHTLLSNTPPKPKQQMATLVGASGHIENQYSCTTGKSSVFTSLGHTLTDHSSSSSSSIQNMSYSSGIPSTVMRRNNRKPHMKRINPTFIRPIMPSSPAKNDSNVNCRALFG